MIKIAICDDDQKMLNNIGKELIEIFKKYGRNIEMDIFTEPNLFIKEIQNKEYRLIFLDFNMPQMNGFEVADQIRKKYGQEIDIVFITSFNDTVYDSFKYAPIAFIRKNNFFFDLEKNIEFILNKIDDPEIYYLVNEGSTMIRINLSNIYYFESAKNYFWVYTNKKNMMVRKPFKSIEDDFKTNRIIKINKGLILNISYVEKIDRNQVILKNNIKLVVSRNYYNELKQRFFDYRSGRI